MPRIPRIEPAAAPAPQLRAPVPTEDFGGGEALGRAMSQVAEIGTRVADTYQRSEANRVFAETQSKLLDLQLSFASDTDYDTQVERFRKERQRIQAEGNKQLGKTAYAKDYELRASQMADRIQFTLAEGANAGRIGRARANLDITLEQYGFNAGRATTEHDRQAILQEALTDIAEAVDRGVLSDKDGVNQAQAFLGNIEMAAVRRMFREGNAADGVRRLLDGDFNLSPERREILIEEGQREDERALRRKVQEDKARATAAKAAVKERARVAFTDLIRRARPGGAGITDADVDAAAADLTTEQLEKATNIVANGGFIRDASSDPVLFLDLVRRAESGDGGAVDEAAQAVLDGALGSGDMEKVRIAASLENRYSKQLGFLRESLGVGEAMLPARDRFIAQNRSAHAKRRFLEELIAHPDMTQTDADTLADAIVASSLYIDISDIPIANSQLPKTLDDIMRFKQENAAALGATTGIQVLDETNQAELVRRSQNLMRWEELLKRRERVGAQKGTP